MKIENKVKEMPAVSEATVDFVSKKLRVEVANKRELEATVANITNVVQKLEPDVKVVREEKNGHDHGHSHDHGEANVKKMVGRLVVGGILTAIAALAGLLQMVTIPLFVLAYLLIGGDIVWRAVRNITRGQVFDENFLMAIATVGAFAIQQYSEAVAVMLFYQVGELFQSIAVNRSRKSITSLMDIRPDYANVRLEMKRNKYHQKMYKLAIILSLSQVRKCR